MISEQAVILREEKMHWQTENERVKAEKGCTMWK